MSNPVKPAVQYVTKGKRRRQANKARVQSNTALEDSGAVAVEQSPWKRSRRQGLEKAIAAVGEGLPSVCTTLRWYGSRLLHWFFRTSGFFLSVSFFLYVQKKCVSYQEVLLRNKIGVSQQVPLGKHRRAVDKYENCK